MVSEGTEPQINTDKHRLNALSEQIIGAAFEVSNVLGTGFLEKVYENALNYLRITGLRLCLLLNFSKPGVEIKRIVNGIQFQ
ncbi:MAG: GxxExxY protein [Candidatus Methanoperedens sp.]|nr:GxxExxY protein [Candidatus Methanoperedens sp.]